MSLPDKRIKKIALPGDVEGSNTYEIVPEKLGKNGHSAELPTLAADATLALTSDLVNADWNAASGAAQILNKPTLGTAASKDTGTSAGNVPVLDGNGKLDSGILPAIALSETFTAGSQAAMLALTAQVGDVCVRTDETKTYILVNTPASTLANWKLLEHPADAVSSVNGKTGVVSLGASDVGASTGTHTHSITPSGSVSLGSNDTASDGVAYIASMSSTGASGSPTTRYLHKTTTNVAPNEHTHSVTVSGTTGANGGTAITAITGYPNFSGGSLTGTTTFVTGVSGGSGSLQSFGTSTGGTAEISSGRIPYVVGEFNESTGVLDLTVKYLDHTHNAASASGTGTVGLTAASLGTPSTGSAAPSGHTHSYGSSTALTTGANSGSAVGAITGLAANTSSDTGDITFLEAYSVSGGTASGTTKYFHPSFTGTAGSTGEPE